MKNSDEREIKKTTVTTVSVVGDANADPLTGAPGARPVATGIGAAGGAAAGAALGSAAGPVGTVVGGAIGAVVGGLAGKGVAEVVDPTVEETYWRTTHATSPPFVKTGYDYSDYGPAYRLGWESRSKHAGSRFPDFEGELAREWDAAKGTSRLGWSDARAATQAAWQRASDAVERITPGDSDRDGK